MIEHIHNGKAHAQGEGRAFPLSRAHLLNITQHFAPQGVGHDFTLADGVEAFHDAVCSAFAHVDLDENERPRVNDFINALQDLYETVLEQSADAEIYYVDVEDLKDITENFDCLRRVICIQHTELQQHDVSSALLWAKTALKGLIASGWGVQEHYSTQIVGA